MRAVRGKWLGQVALIRQPAHRPRRAIGRRSGSRRRPCPRPPYACQELQPFHVYHNTSPSCLLFKPSHPFTGTRVPAAAAGPPPSSPLLRRFSKPRDLPNIFSGSHGSSQCSTWLSPGLPLTAVQFPVGAPPLLRRRRSPESPPVDPPPPIGHG
jgi:hypothetical protein